MNLKDLHTVYLVLVARSFDCAWYRAQNAGFVNDGCYRLLMHYATAGAFSGYSASPCFDEAFYVARYPDVTESGTHPLVHFLKHGAAEGRLPARGLSGMKYSAARALVLSSGLFDPDWYARTYDRAFPARLLVDDFIRNAYTFDPNPDFDSQWYGSQYDDIHENDFFPLLHYIKHGRAEGREIKRPVRQLDLVKATVNSVGDIEPDVLSYRNDIESLSVTISDGVPRHGSYALVKHVLSQIRACPQTVVMVPRLDVGGAEKVALRLTREFATLDAAPPLLLVTDRQRIELEHGLPSSSTVVALPDRFGVDDKVDAINMLVDILRPRDIVNINSRAGWHFLESLDPARKGALRSSAFLFCYDYAEDGAPIDYISTKLIYAINNVDLIVTDNDAIVSEIAEKFSLGAHPKIHCLRQPVECGRSTERPGSDADVLWASRLCRQKNIGLLLEIAALAPEFVFHVWGDGDPKYRALIETATQRLGNLRVHGRFSDFAAIADAPLLAFLYTTLWDGLPNVLLEAAAAGLPILAPAVGGIGELVTHDTGWLIDDAGDAPAFVAALREMRADPAAAARRTAAMTARLRRMHAPDRYAQQVKEIFADA